MKEKNKTIISASRRTDIPAFYYKWLQEALYNEAVIVSNPMFPSKKNTVSLRQDSIHSIVLWSKNFKNVLDNPGLLDNYNLYFQYTITNFSKFLEPYVPDYNETLKTLDGLIKRYRPEQFNIRFDPIIISTKGEKNPTPDNPEQARLNSFEQLCKDLKTLGMDNCRITTSYLSLYGHVAENIAKSGLDITHLDMNGQIEFTKKMVEIADKYNRTIYTCSCPILEKVPGTKKSSCIDGKLLQELFGGKCSIANDSGQRDECGCSKSTEIGGYLPCGHKCKYCYGFQG